MNKNSKIVILGKTGFVGSSLYDRLIKEGYTNILVPGRLEVNLLNFVSIARYFCTFRPEYVFNCAAIVGGIQANLNDPYKFLYENLTLQNNIIQNCIDWNVKKSIYLGSSCIYPKDYKQPLKEEYLLQAPLETTNEGYAIAKIAGLKLCEYANKQFGNRFTCLMPCNLYGPGDHFDSIKSHALSALIKKIVDAKRTNQSSVTVWGTGKAKREWLYIDDLVDCMIWAIEKEINTYINVGTGEDISMKDLIEKICSIVDYKGQIIYDRTKPEGMMKKLLDVSKINKMGWKSKMKLDDGLKKTVKHYQEKLEPIFTTADISHPIKKNFRADAFKDI
jgi:GDP-L-fucose synthase